MTVHAPQPAPISPPSTACVDAARKWRIRSLVIALAIVLIAAGCSSDTEPVATADTDASASLQATAAPEPTDAPAPTAAAEPTEPPQPTPEAADPVAPTVETRDSGLLVTVQPAGDVTVHSVTAPEQVFANSTHIIETANSLVVIDTQFLLPNALDFRAYADSLGKPIDRVFLTHEHPDHFLGSEAFADVDVYALAPVADAIAAIGDAEIAEKQADFGDAIASTFVTPAPVEPGSIDIDGVTFELEEVLDAEAETQLVIKVPSGGVVVTGDIVYSGVHLILAGQPQPWTEALNGLAASADDYPIVLPGHGLPTDPSVYDTNIAWLAKASELMGTAESAAEFKGGLIDAFPDLGMDAAIDFVLPFLFPDSPDAAPTAGEVAFGECAELSTGTVVPLGMLQAQLPDGVMALSLTAQGTVFDGSDDLGVLIARTLRCDEISVTTGGETTSDADRHIAHVGTPVDASVLPASPFNNDGMNGADFNNYIFGYYSDSEAYVAAMNAAGVSGIGTAVITMDDAPVSDCVINRAVSVSDGSFAFNASGEIPDAACEDPVVPFIANWWSVNDGAASVLSNTIPGQAAIFIDTATTTVTIEAVGADLQSVIGTDPVTADAFGVIGLIPPSDGPTLVMTQGG